MITALVKFFVVGLAAVVAFIVLLGVVGLVFSIATFALSLAGFLLFKVLPIIAIIVVGYLIVRILAPREKRWNAGDEQWAESE
jgi:hypothetical protein